MDQKHAMLYPDPNTMPVNERSSAAAAIGLPVEPPPTYDAATSRAIGTAPAGGAPNSHDINYPNSSQYSSHLNQQHHLPVIVEQANIPLPTNHQPPPQTLTQQQQTDSLPINTQPTASCSSKLGPNPSTVTCPICGINNTTFVIYNTFRSAYHFCSNCHEFLGFYRRHRRR